MQSASHSPMTQILMERPSNGRQMLWMMGQMLLLMERAAALRLINEETDYCLVTSHLKAAESTLYEQLTTTKWGG